MSPMIVTLLMIWLGASIVNQFRVGHFAWTRSILHALDRCDPFFFVPSYAFFAPAPLTYDFEVVYRDRLVNESVTPWRVVALFSSRRYRAIWNPEKRKYKVASDLCWKLVREIRWQLSGLRTPNQLYLSVPYVALANYVAYLPHSVASIETQFAVVARPGFDTRKAAAVVFVSPFVRL
jgi:hypothetical protein